jgi:hypothetical protein
MPGQPTPPLIKAAFAHNAAPTYIQNPIPDTTAATDRASFDQGFPPLTMTEILAGGKPPWGQDVNGILNMITAHVAALQAGQPYLFNSTLSTAMGGYLAGITLGMADGSGLWINTVNGNMTDPDGGSAAGWMPLYSQGFASISGLTGGVRTLSSAEYRRNVIVLSGILAGNLQVVVPAGTVGQRSWLIVNNTSGSFTTTVKTASGAGVQVPQGGFSAPTEVYGDGTNVYPTVAPVSLPIDQNPTGLTIAQRTNSGYLFATYFNQSSSLESFTMSGGIYADAGDGYHRKISIANFAAQIALSQFAGQVANAQVPQSAVTQYAAVILASAALTGTPTAPTAVAGTATSQVATTAFVNPGQSLGTNGYQKFPSGMIMQWGTTASIAGNGSSAIFFPISFPNNCLNVQITAQSFSTNQAHDTALAFGNTGFTLQNRSPGASSFYWFAIGF